MPKSANQVAKKNNKRPAFEIFTEIIGFLQIVASPLLLGLIIGSIFYFSNPSNSRLLLGIVIAVVGLLVGIIWATRVWKKRGTMDFMSRISATPELDPVEEKDK